MAAMMLVFLIAFEVAFAIYAVRRRANGKRWMHTRVIASTVELAIALVMALASQGALQGAFGLRFGALVAVMVVRIVMELVIYLVKRSKPVSGQPVRTSRPVRSALRSILLMALALIPAFLFTGYQGLPTTGQHEVAETSAILVDQSRTDPFESDGSAREIPLHFYYPADAVTQDDAAGTGAASSPTDATPSSESGGAAETYPMVVFSHGAFGFYRSNYSTYMELASHGYVVVALDYPHHAFVTEDTDGRTVLADSTFLQTAVAAENNELSPEETFAVTHDWLDLRCVDLNFVLDTLKHTQAEGSFDESAWWFASAADESDVRTALSEADMNHIGLAGHSLGGATSVELGRTRSDIGAVIDIDGTMFGSELALADEAQTSDAQTASSVTADSTADSNQADNSASGNDTTGDSQVFDTTPFPVPLLSIDNEHHYLIGIQEGDGYVNNVVLDNATTATHTYFVGSGHLNFTDLPLFSPTLASLLGTGDVQPQACVEQMNAVVLQFFDYYLKGEGEVGSIAECYDPSSLGSDRE